MGTETTALPAQRLLRQRVHLLERAHSFSGLTPSTPNHSKDKPDISHIESHHSEEPFLSSPTDYETRSESSSDGYHGHGDSDPGSPKPSGSSQDRSRPHIDTSHLHQEHSRSSPMSPSTRAWYEFDLAVVVALVSPIGNWLTGGDHIKNLLLIVLLIFYLHQIIEVPWALYQKARPRKRPAYLPAPSTAEERYKQLADSELRILEFFFLGLTAISPFIGAALLRYATEAVIGKDAVSWFSSGLFVLATGMRPWSQVVERLTQRTTDLHDVIHYPSPDPSANEIRQQMEAMSKRVVHLEKTLAKVKGKVISGTEEVYDYVDDVVDAVERTVRRHERRCDKHEAKVKDIEETVESLRNKGKLKAGTFVDTHSHHHFILTSLLPDWLLHPSRYGLYGSIYSPSSVTSKHTLRSFPSLSSIPLETIPEDVALKSPILAQPYTITSNLVYRAGYIATMPLRAVLRMILQRY